MPGNLWLYFGADQSEAAMTRFSLFKYTVDLALLILILLVFIGLIMTIVFWNTQSCPCDCQTISATQAANATAAFGAEQFHIMQTAVAKVTATAESPK